MTRPAKLIGVIASFGCMSAEAMAYCPGEDPTSTIYQPDYYSLEKEFARSELVVEAVVERETWLGPGAKPAPLSPSGEYIGTWYDLRVVRSFKGDHSARLRLFSENSNARFDFDEGKPYILLVDRWSFDPPIETALTIDTCGNSARASDDPSLLARVSGLGGRKPTAQ
jgi:hypothetical protein